MDPIFPLVLLTKKLLVSGIEMVFKHLIGQILNFKSVNGQIWKYVQIILKSDQSHTWSFKSDKSDDWE